MVSFVWDGETRCKNIKRIALRAICTTFVMHLFLPLKCVGGVVLSDSLQCTDEAEFVICLHLKKSEREGITILFLFLNMTQGTEKSMGKIKKIATRLNCLVW